MESVKDDFDDLNFTPAEIDQIAEGLESQRTEHVKGKKSKSEKRQREVVVSVRMTPEEFSIISKMADASKVKISAFLRNSALRSLPFAVNLTRPEFTTTHLKMITTYFIAGSDIEPSVINFIPFQSHYPDWVSEIEEYSNADYKL